MSKENKTNARKQHFELSPANKRRMAAYLEWYNAEPSRVTTKWKIGDVVNAALDKWLLQRLDQASNQENTADAKKASQN